MQSVGTERSPGSAGTGGSGSGLPGSWGTGDGRAPRRVPVSGFLIFLLVASLGAAVYFRKMSAPGAIAAAVFGGGALYFAVALVRALDRGERASFESAWGGLGSGLGGWRVSKPLVYLAAAAVFGALLMAVAVQEMPARSSDRVPAATEGDEEEAGDGSEATDDQEDGAGELDEPAAGASDTEGGGEDPPGQGGAEDPPADVSEPAEESAAPAAGSADAAGAAGETAASP